MRVTSELRQPKPDASTPETAVNRGPSVTTTKNTCPAYPQARDRRCPFDPPKELLDLQEEAALVRVDQWDGREPWLVTRYDEVREVLADRRASADTFLDGFPHMSAAMEARQRKGKTFINMDDPDHGVQRRLLAADFTVRRIETMRPDIQKIVDDLIDDMLAGPKPVDLVQALALPLPSLVICELLGVPYEDRALFHRLSVTINDSGVTPEQSAGAMEDLIAYLEELVDRKNADPGDDLLSRLVVNEYRTGSMARDEIARMARLLLVAGHDTTANMIALGTLALFEHPTELARLQREDDPELAASACEELLRYLTVTHWGRRRVALDDFDLGEEHISRGEGIIAASELANRDPRVFEDPHRLDLGRNPRNHIAFGYGIHQCLGQPIARLELQVVYGTLYRRIPTLRLAVPIEEISFKDDMAVYGVNALPVTW
jgi:cytochrome P450